MLAYTYAEDNQFAKAATWARQAAELALDEESKEELLGLAEEWDSFARDAP